MSITDTLIRLLNLRKEESKPAFYLMVFSFFVGLSMSFYFAASNAIFLKHFQPWMISISYMASGVIVWAAWFLLSRLDKRMSLPSQLIVKFLFVFTTVLAISIGVWLYDTPWIVFIMYTWVRILTYVTLITFWGLAGKLFNIRQGKRIFSLLGTGEVISIIIGYFSIPVLLGFIKAPDLLFFASVTLLFCFVMVLLILKRFKNELAGAPSTKSETPTEKSAFSYWTLVKKPYFRLISMMALLPIFGYLFIDFIFLSQTKIEFSNNPETIAGFFGVFLGFVAVIELLFKLVSGRILSKYGIKPSLLSLPVILSVTIFIAALSGSIYGTTGLFFAFIALTRLFERSVRSAMYEPTFQLLYQPVPPEQRMIFQNQIEGIPKAFGTVITGAVILLLSYIHWLNLIHFNWFFIVVLGIWIYLTVKMYESYRNMIRSKLFELKATVPVSELDNQHQQVLSDPENDQDEEKAEEISFELLTHLCRSENPDDRIRAARLLGESGRYNIFKMLHTLLQDEHPEVRKAAIRSSGQIKRMELYPYLFDQLADPAYADQAAKALASVGEPVIPELERLFEKSNSHPEIQEQIIEIISHIPGNRATRFLKERISFPSRDISRQIITALSKRDYKASASESTRIKAQMEETVKYILWLFASMNDLSGYPDVTNLQLALMDELEDQKEFIFVLLSLLHDSKTIHHIREHIESKDTTAKVYALEIGDMIIGDEIKELFFPIFEDMLIQERLNRFADRFPQPQMKPVDRIMDIINQEYTRRNKTSKYLALQILGESGSSEVTDSLLAANLLHPVSELRKAAAQSLQKVNDPYFKELVALIRKSDHSLATEWKKIISPDQTK
jgi:ATP:ADP antiporter, AAA family